MTSLMLPQINRTPIPGLINKAENLFSCLKCGLAYITRYVTCRQAQNSIFRYIKGFYNPVRPYSSNGWLSPMEYTRQLKR
ncbi:IS3 family transposase [Ruminococcus champanellensis]|uniref:IS3 family transposase n=1 Tax=Ruminococcus champanellensis TaxID=1161942 RepID=UPI0039F60FCE